MKEEWNYGKHYVERVRESDRCVRTNYIHIECKGNMREEEGEWNERGEQRELKWKA